MPALYINGEFASHLYSIKLLKSYLLSKQARKLAQVKGKGETWILNNERFTIIYP